MPVVKSLFVYPIKSFSAIECQSLTIDKLGPIPDRRLMLVDENDRFISLRSTQSLVEFDVSLSGNIVKLGFGNKVREIDINAEYNDISEFRIWQDTVKGAEINHDLSNWISDILEKNVRLVIVLPETNRQVNPKYSDPGDIVSFADGFPFLITSQASHEKFSEMAAMPVEPLRFRPNIIIDGISAWEEDLWACIEINGITFNLTIPCARCGVPSVDPVTGEKEVAITKALAKHRRYQKKTWFGMNAIHKQEGTISVGDEVKVLEVREQPHFMQEPESVSE